MTRWLSLTLALGRNSGSAAGPGVGPLGCSADYPAEWSRAARRSGWLHVSGGYKLPGCLLQGKWDKDEMVEQARNVRDFLAEVGVNVRYEEYDGDASLPADHPARLMAAVRWLMGQKKASYKPPPDFDERFREAERRDDGRSRGTNEGGR
ncbi:MAG: hypothetical protein AB1486_31400 [Planctomycetota bacterium]